MNEFNPIAPLDTGTFKVEVYQGGAQVMFLRISERAAKDVNEEWQEACLSADEARQLRAYLDRALPDQIRDEQ